MSSRDAVETVMSSLREFRDREYDWNGSAGLPMRSDAADTLSDVYQGIPSVASLPDPVISLENDGTISVEYERENESDLGKKLFLTFVCDGVMTYMQVFTDGSTTVDGTIRLDRYESPDGAFDASEASILDSICEWYLGGEEQ